MLKDALRLLQDTAVDAKTAVLIDLPGDGREKLLDCRGEVSRITIKPPCRKHVVCSLANLIEYAKRVVDALPQDDAPRDTTLPARGAPVCWHGPRGVNLVIDDADRRDTVAFPLTFSGRLVRLQRLEKEPATFDQKRFVRLLRVELGLPNEGLVAKFRKLDWRVADEASGTVQHGRDRMGKSIQAEVEGIEDLPEEIGVPVPVYCEAGERTEYIVRCAVELDAINQTFALTPLPEEIQKVIDLHQADIRARLVAELNNSAAHEVPIYYGAP